MDTPHDKNGVPIKVGQRAVVVFKQRGIIDNGSIGEVRDIKGGEIRVTKGEEDCPEWSSWCDPSEVVMV